MRATFLSNLKIGIGKLAILGLVAGCLIWTGPQAQAAVVNGCETTGSTYPASTGSAGFGGGLGTSVSPWLICSRNQLAAIGTNLNTLGAHYSLKSDINLAGSVWTPIVMRDSRGFYGVFDGGFFSISNAVVGGDVNNGAFHSESSSSSDADLYGLFAYFSGTLRNLDIRGFRVTSEAVSGIGAGGGRFPMAGAIAGSVGNGAQISKIRISDSRVEGNAIMMGLIAGYSLGTVVDLVDASDSANAVTPTLTSAGINVGGFIGRAQSNSLVKRSVYGGSVGNASLVSNQTFYVAGIIGFANYGSVDQSIVTGTIIGGRTTSSKQLGGFVGLAENHASVSQPFTVRDSVFAGQISETEAPSTIHRIGGIAGLGDTDVDVVRVLVVGQLIQSGAAVGPIVGGGFRTTSEAYFNSSLLSTFDDAQESGDGKTTAQLQDTDLVGGLFSSWSIATAGSASVTSGWAFDPGTPVWKISTNNYPTHVWRDFWPASVGTPSAVSATSPAVGTASISWTSGPGSASYFQIEQSSDSGATWVIAIANTGSNSNSTSIAGLTPGMAYQFRIKAFSTSAFASPVSAASAALLMGSSPGVPENLRAQNLSFSSFRVSWDPPNNTGGLSITSYTLQVDKGNGYETVAHTGTSADISGVFVDSSWSFRVLATNVVGSSAYAVYTNIPPVPYAGPLITNLSLERVIEKTVAQILVRGDRLSLTTSATVDSLPVKILSKSDNQMLIELPALTVGTKDLVLVSSAGNLTHQQSFEVVPALSAPVGKVNVGSFNGKLVVYAAGLTGKRISWKVGGRWGGQVASSNYSIFNRPTPRAGVTLNVEIFVDGKSALTKQLVTR